MSERQTVGWIGAGAMGLPICRHLLKAGCEVVVYDRLPERVAPAVAAGASGADSIRQLARRCELVFSMVYDDQAFETVVTGSDGVLAGIRPGSLYIDMSTVSPGISRQMAVLLARQGVRYLRAPVSGSVGLLRRSIRGVRGGPLVSASGHPPMCSVSAFAAGCRGLIVGVGVVVALLWYCVELDSE